MYSKKLFQFSKLLKCLILFIFCIIFLFHTLIFAGTVKNYNILDFGALGDGIRLNTAAIQKTIDACAEAGGGTVYFPPGRFLSGTIYLKNNVTLFLDAGAVLLGSKDLGDYPVTIQKFRSYTDNYTDKSLIYAEQVQNIALIGRGVIDGQGAAFSGPYKVRPYMLRIIECKNVTVRDVTIMDSPMWVQHYLACENVNIDGITIHSLVNKNNDGIDIDCCQKVRISNCEINSGDDAIVLKSTADMLCRDVVVTNCVLRSWCNALKMGTESNGGFQNISISNCAIYNTRLSGIALETVDGGTSERLNISNITMENVGSGIFIRLGNRARPFKKGMEKPSMGSLKDIVISNVQAIEVDNIGCSITGLPNYPVENVTLENIRINFQGGGTAKHALREIEEFPEKYPEYKMFGVLPAYGFYCRHVNNLKFHHIELGFEKPDHRPALICEDVQDLELFDFDAKIAPSAKAMVWLKRVRGAFLHGCRPKSKIGLFAYIDDQRTENITIMNNDLSNVNQIVMAGEGVAKKNLYIKNNRQ